MAFRNKTGGFKGKSTTTTKKKEFIPSVNTANVLSPKKQVSENHIFSGTAFLDVDTLSEVATEREATVAKGKTETRNIAEAFINLFEYDNRIFITINPKQPKEVSE